jgi:hypothetical protein
MRAGRWSATRRARCCSAPNSTGGTERRRFTAAAADTDDRTVLGMVFGQGGADGCSSVQGPACLRREVVHVATTRPCSKSRPVRVADRCDRSAGTRAGGCAASPIAAILGDDSRTGKLRLAIERSPKPSVERFRADHRLRSDVRLSAGAQAGSEEVCAALVDLHGGAGAGHRRGRRAARARPDSPLSGGGRVSGAALCASEITHSSTPRSPARRQRRARGRQSMPLSASPRPRA